MDEEEPDLGNISATTSSSSDANISGDSYTDRLDLYLQDENQVQIGQRSLTTVIQQEMALFESSKIRPANLEKLYLALKTIRPTSVESERAFSALGRFITPLRTRLSDRSLDGLIFMRQHFLRNRQIY